MVCRNLCKVRIYDNFCYSFLVTINIIVIDILSRGHTRRFYTPIAVISEIYLVSPTTIANFADSCDWRIKSPVSSMSDTSD